ncbi:hypothetical protein ABC347_12425 [Sphingomonas sp. 1P06PA]
MHRRTAIVYRRDKEAGYGLFLWRAACIVARSRRGAGALHAIQLPGLPTE